MQFYRRNLPHLQKDFNPHFITFVYEIPLDPSSTGSGDHPFFVLSRSSKEVRTPRGGRHARSCAHDPHAAHRRTKTGSLFTRRDHADDQKCICALDQSTTQPTRSGMAGRVIRSRAAFFGRTRREGGVCVAESGTQRISCRLAGVSLGVAKTRSASGRYADRRPENVAPDASSGVAREAHNWGRLASR